MSTAIQTVTTKQGVKGNRPILEGTKLSVAQILELVNEAGLQPEQMAERYPDIKSGKSVEEVLRWARDHPDRVSELRKQRERSRREFTEDAVVY